MVCNSRLSVKVIKYFEIKIIMIYYSENMSRSENSDERTEVMNKKYQDVISMVSSQLADEFLMRENDLEKRALLLDSDIAEITRQIGCGTARKVLGSITDKCADKKNRKVL